MKKATKGATTDESQRERTELLDHVRRCRVIQGWSVNFLLTAVRKAADANMSTETAAN